MEKSGNRDPGRVTGWPVGQFNRKYTSGVTTSKWNQYNVVVNSTRANNGGRKMNRSFALLDKAAVWGPCMRHSILRDAVRRVGRTTQPCLPYQQLEQQCRGWTWCAQLSNVSAKDATQPTEMKPAYSSDKVE